MTSSDILAAYLEENPILPDRAHLRREWLLGLIKFSKTKRAAYAAKPEELPPTFGRVAYRVYIREGAWPLMPTWPELEPELRARWEAGASSARSSVHLAELVLGKDGLRQYTAFKMPWVRSFATAKALREGRPAP